MTIMPQLRTALLDVLYETRNHDLKLILGGGYGIYLKREQLRAVGTRTLMEEWPEARSTSDLDLFLRPELLIDSARLKPLAQAMPRLGYSVVAGAEKYQFMRPGPAGDEQGRVKIDFLTGPRSRFAGSKVKVDQRRVRPRPSIDLHAHPTDEAITLDVGLAALSVEGATSGGTSFRGEVYLPHPFTFGLMKLFAYRDRNRDPDKDYGRYHALDLYSILAMTSELEWEQALQLSQEHAHSGTLTEAGSIVREHFLSITSEGMLRMRESQYYRPTLQIDTFLSAIGRLFPPASAGTNEQ